MSAPRWTPAVALYPLTQCPDCAGYGVAGGADCGRCDGAGYLNADKYLPDGTRRLEPCDTEDE